MEKQKFYSLKNLPSEKAQYNVIISERGYGRTYAEKEKKRHMEEYYFNNLTLDAAFRYAAERDECFKTRHQLVAIANDFKELGNKFYYDILIEDLARSCGRYFYYTSPLTPLVWLWRNDQIKTFLEEDGLWS